MKFSKHCCALAMLVSLPAWAAPAQLSLEQAISVALERDPALRQSQVRETALSHQAIADGQLPDPTLKFGMMNVPTDTWDTNQENMTQLQLGITQMLPRGDTLRLKSETGQLNARTQQLMQVQRKAQLRRDVSLLWLEGRTVSHQQQLLAQGVRQLKPLVSAAGARYRSGVSRQQDQLDADLALTRLQARQQQLDERMTRIRGRLSGWLGYQQAQLAFAPVWPEINASTDSIIEQHPELAVLSQQTQLARKKVRLAEEAYKPALGVSLSYGYREDMPSGRERADMASIGVSMDLPLFTGKRQDQRLKAAQSDVTAAMEARQLVFNRLQGQYKGEIARQQQLKARLALYDRQLLPQLGRKADAAADAYGRDQASIAELTQAELAVVLGKLERSEVKREQLASLIRLQYLSASTDSAVKQGGDHE